jgi:hypothetical protein
MRLDPTYYRHVTYHVVEITKQNIDALLDAGLVEVHMKNGNWWKIRRNGQTKRWKRDTNRIKVPFKMGLYGYGAITETDFV